MPFKLSIVIPCYNVEKYIERCLLSVMTQDLPHSEYEVIAINDGSTDGTLSLMEELAKRYSNIKIVDKKNEGLSATRNCGLDISYGEYIMFLDSDDWIAENCLKTIYDKAYNDKLDILECDFRNVDEDGRDLNIGMFEGLTRFSEGRVVDGREYLLTQKAFLPMVWARIYRRDFLVENNIRMAPIRHEDEEFTPRVLSLAKRMEYLSLPFYFYVTREGSITTAYRDQNYFDIVTAMGNIYEFIKVHIPKKDRIFHKYFTSHIRKMLIEIYQRSVKNNRPIQLELVLMMKKKGICPSKLWRRYFFLLLFNCTPDKS